MRPNDPKRDMIFYECLQHIIGGRHQKNLVKWRGTYVIKLPEDLILYAEVIHEYKPEVIIESGTAHGGSALFFADMMAINGFGTVVTIDRDDRKPPAHPNVVYILGDVRLPETFIQAQRIAAGKKTMVVLDSRHTPEHIMFEVRLFGPLVTPGQFLVIEDITPRKNLNPRRDARPLINEFLATDPAFERVPMTEKFLDCCVSRNGWLRRR
jgi:cephalosporin hydroxylase